MATTYDIPPYPTRRLRYFHTQKLLAQEFVNEQAYHIAQSRAHLSALSVAGVCKGMALTYVPATKSLNIGKGFAVDAQGRIIALATEAQFLAPAGALNGTHRLHARFDESAILAQDGKPGQEQYWEGKAALGATPQGQTLPADAIVLGSFSIEGGVITQRPDYGEGRQHSGLRLPGAVDGMSLTSGSKGKDAVLNVSLTLRSDGSPARGPVLSLVNGSDFPGAAGSGAAIDFSAYDPKGKDPALRLSSSGDGHGSSDLMLSTKEPGSSDNGLVDRLRFTSSGALEFLPDSGTERYGVGRNAKDLSLFCAADGSVSVRKGSRSGQQIFSVSGSGAGTFKGNLRVEGLLNVASSDSEGTLTVTGNRQVARFVGEQSCYLGFYPKGLAEGVAPSWFGYGRANNTALEIANQLGDIELYAAGAVRFMNADLVVERSINVKGRVNFPDRGGWVGYDTQREANSVHVVSPSDYILLRAPKSVVVYKVPGSSGDLSVEGNLTVRGQFVGPHADCAEDFDIDTDITVEPGMVMVVGEDGALVISQRAHDKRVVGVVSGAGDYEPAIILDRQESGRNRQPVALLGKVYCKVDARYGAIQLGDLLTSSPTPGHAMRVDEPINAVGAVIGKALRALPEGQGLIPILVALQ